MNNEPIFQIVALVGMVPEAAGQIFHNDAVDLSGLNESEQPLKIRAFLIGGAAYPVIDEFIHQYVFVVVELIVEPVCQDKPLIMNALGFVVSAGILTGQPDVKPDIPGFAFACFRQDFIPGLRPCHSSSFPAALYRKNAVRA